jgi:Transposase DDE domain group 1
LRSRLIKVAARVVEMKTMIKVHMPTACPAQDLLLLVLTRIPKLVT